jgi:hypothetical protein
MIRTKQAANGVPRRRADLLSLHDLKGSAMAGRNEAKGRDATRRMIALARGASVLAGTLDMRARTHQRSDGNMMINWHGLTQFITKGSLICDTGC